MDADILAAATALDLEKIKAQDYRNALISQKADREAFRGIVQAMQTWQATEYAKLPPESTRIEQLRDNLFLKLAEKYMTPPGTATLTATIDEDAANDARRLAAAFREASALIV
jgi:hypothetical protein